LPAPFGCARLHFAFDDAHFAEGNMMVSRLRHNGGQEEDILQALQAQKLEDFNLLGFTECLVSPATAG